MTVPFQNHWNRTSFAMICHYFESSSIPTFTYQTCPSYCLACWVGRLLRNKTVRRLCRALRCWTCSFPSVVFSQTFGQAAKYLRSRILCTVGIWTLEVVIQNRFRPTAVSQLSSAVKPDRIEAVSWQFKRPLHRINIHIYDHENRNAIYDYKYQCIPFASWRTWSEDIRSYKVETTPKCLHYDGWAP